MADDIILGIQGLESVLANLDRFDLEVQVKCQALVIEAAGRCLQESQDACPVGQDVMGSIGAHAHFEHVGGSLKGSAKVKYPKRLTAEVSYGGSSTTGVDVDYAVYVIMGHHTRSGSFVPPNDFLTPAWENAAYWLEEEANNL